MIMLFDYDSVIYKSCYMIVSFSDIRLMFSKGWSREKIEKEIVDLCVTRLCQIGDNIVNEIDSSDFIQDQGIDIEYTEYFITRTHQSIRRKLFPDYKSNRIPKPIDKWVRRVRNYLIEGNISIVDDEWEADDLIADRAKELGVNNCIIVSIDKDLQTLPGLHFNYYQKPSKEVDQYGNKVKNPMKGFIVVDEEKALYNFYYQMLIGDGSDGISGVQGIGPKTASMLLFGLSDEQDFKTVTMSEYINKYGANAKYMYKKNEFLLKLGKRDVDKFIKTLNE